MGSKKTAKASRDDLVKQAQDAYASASKTGGSEYASVTNYLASQTDAAKDTTFDTWSESDIKHYLDSYGVSNYQGSNLNELRAEARKQYNFFKYGTSTPSGTIFERIKSGLQWILGQASAGAQTGSVRLPSLLALLLQWLPRARLQLDRSCELASNTLYISGVMMQGSMGHTKMVGLAC